MLAKRNARGRYDIIDDDNHRVVCRDAQYGWALNILRNRGYSQAAALAILHTDPGREWSVAMRLAKDRT